MQELFGGVFGRGARLGDRAWLRAMLDTEAGLARALERAGLAPAGAGACVTSVAVELNFDATELGELAALTANPVPALSRQLARLVAERDASSARAVHYGATSQDIIDTAAMLLARHAIDMTLADLEPAASAAAALADAHRGSVMIGRTLLQQAVPVTFGLTAAGWLSGLDAAIRGLRAVRGARLAVQFGGAAGTLASLGPDGPQVAALLATELGLACPRLPWHAERLRIIDTATALARVTAVTGKIARDVTLLAQNEVGEVREGDPRRGGSSSMPHKNNPVASIAILGCARQVPGLLATLVASAEAEHQRAAGAWHAEWEPFTAVLNLASSAGAWANDLLSGLRVDTGRMAANLNTLNTLSTERIEATLDPSAYLGASDEFVTAALSAHESRTG